MLCKKLSSEGIVSAKLVELIEKHDVDGPYYTSYPTGKVWSNEFSVTEYKNALVDMINCREGVPITLYIHFPFCVRLCRFCFCYTKITKNRDKTNAFLQILFREMTLLKELFDQYHYKPNIREIHLGGGSPSYMTEEEFEQLIANIKLLVDPFALDEFAIEIDAITVTQDKLKLYHQHGITRISFGIQDFAPEVQEVIGRVQSPQLIEKFLVPEIRQLFNGVNFDLMYGLPLQTRASFKETVDTVLKLSPDRISLYNYFHMPELYKHQAKIKEADLPNIVEKTMIFVDATQRFIENGYESIGIDHFAKSSDGLAIAKISRTLTRHFMGYTTGGAPNLIGLGPSSLGGFTGYYTQNVYSLEEYQSVLANNEFPILRGYQVSHDDIIRKDVIDNLLCYFDLDFKVIESKYQIKFNEYFSEELKSLDRFIADGILTLSENSVCMTSTGQLFTRHVCALFDKYLVSSFNDRNSSDYVPVIQRSGTSDYVKYNSNYVPVTQR